jgi:hypothetical protein
MMKKMISLSVILAMPVWILWGCSSSSHLHNSHPQMEKQEEKRGEISIVFNEKEVKLPIRQIPPINQFLEQLDPTQREQEMSRFRITTFSSKTGDLYADVGYNCGEKLCDHVMIQVKDGTVKSFPLRPASMYAGALLSPSEELLAIQLGRDEGTDLVRSGVVVIDTDRFKEAHVQNNNEMSNELFSEEFTWPIYDMKWIDNQTIEITIPDTRDHSFTTLAKWKQQDKPTKTVKITFDL